MGKVVLMHCHSWGALVTDTGWRGMKKTWKEDEGAQRSKFIVSQYQ